MPERASRAPFERGEPVYLLRAIQGQDQVRFRCVDLPVGDVIQSKSAPMNAQCRDVADPGIVVRAVMFIFTYRRYGQPGRDRI